MNRIVNSKTNRYGCWNKPSGPSYWTAHRQLVLNRFIPGCQYDKRTTDSKCEGCNK